MEIGKRVYDKKRKQYVWIYTPEERELLRQQMMAKQHTVLEVVEIEKVNNKTYVTYNNGITEKADTYLLGICEDKDFCGIRGKNPNDHIPFNPNRGQIKETFDWGNKYEN